MTQTTLTLTEQIDDLKTPAKGLLRNLYDAWADALIIPNELLPQRMRSQKAKGKTVAQLTAIPKPTPAELKRIENEEREIEKELRLDEYCKDAENGREIRYHEDEERLYRNQLTFANSSHPRAGVLLA